MGVNEQGKGQKMRNYTFILIGLFLCLGVTAFGQTDNDDVQVWNQNSFEFPLVKDNDRLSGVVSNDFRVTEDVSNLDDIRFGFAVKYKVTDNLSIAPNYVFRVSRVSGGPDRYQHQLRFDVTPSKKFKNFSVDNRSRFEHRANTGGRDDETYYRNRTRIRVPVKKDGKTLFTPYISTDVWLDIQNPDLFRNDAAAGISRKINDNTSLKVFYNYRHNFQDSPRHEHAIGFGFSFEID